MIDRGDIRQQSTVAAISASLPGAGYGQFEHKAGQPDCKIQRSGRNGQRLMYEQSHRDYLRSAICIIVCLSSIIITTVITPLPTKPSATKMPEN